MKITINVRGFQDTLETTVDGNDVVLWHTHDGKDVCINRFDGTCWDVACVQKYAMDYLKDFYEEGAYEIIDDGLPRPQLNKHQKQVVDWYLDWVNNFLTIERFCEYYGFSIIFATELISEGKHLLENGNNETV